MGAVASAPHLRLRGIRVDLPDGRATRSVLGGVDLDVAAGEVAVVTGVSGSGKSTLLAVAGLLRRADAGEVAIDGVGAAGLSERRRTAIRRRHVAIVYQSANLVPALTACEQLELVGHLQGERRASARARAAALLDELGLGAHRGQLPGQLSGGERQRVGIARALMARPSVLLADEPTASLDPALSAEVASVLAEQARRQGAATLVVTHDDAPLRLADRHLHLTAGRLEAAVAG
jgi:putative ABC transport system ATP-binding protein